MKWCWSNFFVKLTSRQFWVWLITTYIVYTLLLTDGEHAWFLPLITVWGVISVLYLGGTVLVDAIGKMIEKANLTVTQNNSVSTNINGNIGDKK